MDVDFGVREVGVENGGQEVGPRREEVEVLCEKRRNLSIVGMIKVGQ